MKPTSYQFIGTPLESAGLTIVRIGLHESAPGAMVHRPLGQGCYLIAVFHTEVTIRVHGVIQHCPPNSLIVWEPDVCHYYGNPTMPWEYSWVACDGPFLQTLLESSSIPCNEIIQLSSPDCLDHFMQNLQWELAYYLQPDVTLLRNHLQNLFIEIRRQLSFLDIPRPLPSWASTIKQYLDANYTQTCILEQLMEQTHLSRTHLFRKFKDVFGVAPLEYLTQIRMHRAKELLLDDNLSIADIAARTGYSHFSHFAAMFRRHYGVSPREMRKGNAVRPAGNSVRRSAGVENWHAGCVKVGRWHWTRILPPSITSRLCCVAFGRAISLP